MFAKTVGSDVRSYVPAYSLSAAVPARTVSIFDVDRTLTRKPTYSAFLLFGAWRTARWRLGFVPLVVAAMLAYKMGFTDRASLKQFMQARMLGPTIANDRAKHLAEAFAERMIRGGIYAQARAMIENETANGRRVILATAAHHFYVDALAEALGIGDVVATCSRYRRGKLTAEIAGQNCYGAAKRDQVAALFDREGASRRDLHVRVFSDDLSDRPLFEWADEPIAVNPSRRLKSYAQTRGWTILDWR